MEISVLMSVYAKEKGKYLDQAIESIVNQTYLPAEIVLVKDGRLNDELEEVILKWENLMGKELKVISNDKNLGLAKSLNKGLEYCSYEYVARMDSDDVSLPNRFEIQKDFIKENKNVTLVGGWYKIFNEDMSVEIGKREVPTIYDDIKKYAKYRTPINHPTIIFKKNVIKSIGGYSECVGRFEDWELCFKLIKNNYVIANIPEYILNFRSSKEQMRRRGGIKYLIEEFKMLKKFYNEGHFDLATLFINLAIRTPVRLLPISIRKVLYSRIWK